MKTTVAAKVWQVTAAQETESPLLQGNASQKWTGLVSTTVRAFHSGLTSIPATIPGAAHGFDNRLKTPEPLLSGNKGL